MQNKILLKMKNKQLFMIDFFKIFQSVLKHRHIYASFFIFHFSFFIVHSQNMQAKITYPETRKDTSVVDDYFGTKVADPYRWLENDNSDETKDWVKRQNAVTFAYLEKLPLRNVLKERIEKMWNYEKFSAPFKEGGKYYFFKNSGLQNQSVLYVQDSLDAPATIILDPNTISKEGIVALGTVAFNKIGNKMAYQLAKAGSDWQTIYVKDVKTGETLKDEIKWVKFSGISWYGDGFFYSRYPEPEKGHELTAKAAGHKIYFHKIGTEQGKDKLIIEDKKNPKTNLYCTISDDERFLAVYPTVGTSGNEIYVKDLKAKTAFKKIVTNQENDWHLIDNDGDNLLIMTNYKATRNRILSINFNNPEEKNWKEMIHEDEHDVIQSAGIVGEKLFLNMLHNASSRIKIYDLKGAFLGELNAPGGIGTIGGPSGKRHETQAFYSFSSFTHPPTIYAYDTKTFQSKVFKAPKIDFNPELYVTEQKFYKSHDGSLIPMFITMKKGTKLDGKNPTLLYGYGGFNISVVPSFSVSRIAYLDEGGIYVSANIRGGGEFGEAWHKAGTKENKENVFYDFISAAYYLIDNKYTSSEHLGIQGGSNGGLLVGACMTKRPDLFKVALPAVGVMDMLRYHQFTIGRAWSVDYGLSEDKIGFNYLYKYSPLHNIKKGTKYPATLVTTGDHDDRVVPAHSFKFAATLQAAQTGDNPTLIRIETSAGHGAGKPTSKVIQEAADIFAFLLYHTK